jgi:NADH:ubiquinone oxidoreductase subunit 4 (subunit M)
MFGCYSFIFGRGSLLPLGNSTWALSNIQGIGGSIPPMLIHVLVPLALFLCVGVLYDQRKTQPFR